MQEDKYLQKEEEHPHVDSHVPVQAHHTELSSLKARTKILREEHNSCFVNIETYIQVEVRDVGNVGQHHGKGQDPDQGQHHMDREPLCIRPGKYLVSVNAESKEAEHDGVAGKVLGIVLDKSAAVEDYLEHGKDKAEELSKEPVVNKQDKQRERQREQQLQMIVPDYCCLVLAA